MSGQVMDEQSLLTWFQQIDERIFQVFIRGTHQYALRAGVLTEMQTALESVFLPSDAVRRRWEDARSRESQAFQRDFAGALDFVQDELVEIFRVAHRLLQEGHAQRFADGIRAETIMQCLDQADALARTGYADAAMVLAGGAMESHLRALCVRFSLSWQGNGSIGSYKQALDQARNQGTQNVVSASDSSQIDSWAKDRNDAAHTPVNFIKTPQAVLYIVEGIRQFLGRTQ
jgi:hypothetical protein